jgi:hypothetical protein
MTGQSLLDAMEIVNPELQLQSGETDVAKGLIALNMAQDHLESLLATIPGCLGGQSSTVPTVANTETVSFPSGLLRLDRIQFVDPATSKPIYDMTPIYNVGGHINSYNFPASSISSTGRPDAYYTDGTSIYLSPTPDAIYTLRYYGFISASDITAGGTFAYKDIARLPMAVFATRLMSIGVNDEQGDLMELAQEVFKPVLRAYDNFRAESGRGFQYKYNHDT